MEHAKHNKEDTCQKRCDGQTLETILLDDAVNNNNECACRTTDLNLGTSEDRYDQSGDDGGDNTFLRRHARGDTEGDGQRQCHDADNNAGEQICRQLLPVVILQRRKQLWFEL